LTGEFLSVERLELSHFLTLFFVRSDFYSENSTTLSEAENLAVIDAITDLWILFANFESQRNQFKRAIEVFDQAMNHPVVGRGAKIYQSYAKYCMSRNKPGIAQKGFIRGLTANLSVENSDQLWFSFLDLTQNITKNKSYSLQQLYDEVCSQLSTSELPKLAPLPVATATKATTNSMSSLPSAPLKASAAIPEVRSQPAPSQQQAAPIIAQVTSVNIDKKPVPVALHHAAPDEHDSLYDMPPDQMIRVFRLRPPMIFVAPNKVSSSFSVFNYCLISCHDCRNPWYQGHRRFRKRKLTSWKGFWAFPS
jgi:hypothetical protein